MIVDLFAGPGGWDLGARWAGLPDPVGIEIDADACATRTLNILLTIRADVATYPRGHLAGRVDGVIASPPCPDWSTAGSGTKWDGETGRLVHEALRWTLDLEPRWCAWEQVPPALEAWRRFRPALLAAGYSVWCGILNSADYGVAQTRQRAILLARRDGVPAAPPAPTHAKHPEPTLFGPALLPWVSMGDALGWDESDMLHTNRDQRPDGTRQIVSARDPAPTLTGKAGGQWVLRPGGGKGRRKGPRSPVSGAAPAPTLAFGNDAASWLVQTDTFERRLTICEALTLQSFPGDYRLAGTDTSRYQQTGNAVPPLLAAACLQQFGDTR